MSILPNGSEPIALSFSGEIAFHPVSPPSPLEQEVIELYEQLRNPLLRYVLSFRLTQHDGEEVVQEVFLALFQHLRRGKSRENLRGWIFRVGHNLALKLRTRNSMRTRFQSDERAADRQADDHSNPEEDIVRVQRQRRLLSVINVLSEQDRCCLYLRAEGLRYREIAEVVGVSLGTVSISLARSLGRLTNVDGRY
jgi:RNA polymerase sigma-70 factor (ECF subfamily)